MRKKPPSIFATFREMPQVYTASAVEFDAIGHVWRRYASLLPFYTPDDITENDIRREQQLGYRLNYGEQ